MSLARLLERRGGAGFDLLAVRGRPGREGAARGRFGVDVPWRNLADAPALFGAGLAFLLSANLLGPINPALAQLATVVVLVAVSSPAWGPSWRRAGRAAPLRAWAARLAPLLPLALAPLSSDAGQAARLFGTLATLVALARLPEPAGRARSAVMAEMVGFASMAYLAGEACVPAWKGLEAASAALSTAAGWLSGGPVSLGPVASGLWPLLLGVGVGLRAAPRRPAATLRHAAVVAAAAIAFAAYQMQVEQALAALAQMALAPPPQHLADADQPLRLAPGSLTGLSTVAVLAVVSASAALNGFAAAPQAGQSPAEPHRARPHRPRLRVAGWVALAAGSSALLFAPAPDYRPGRTIAFYDADLDLSKPIPGRYGLIQAGLYGGLWDLLELAGYRCVKLTEAQIGAEDGLRGVDALAVIMPRHALAPAAHEALWRFVRRGGGLLALGDHTDIFGVMAPLDQLLAPVGVRFVYDAAYPLRRHWQYALDIRPHPVTRGIKDQLEVQIGTGASLDLAGGSAFPAIVGRYAFSDQGNLTNTGYGAGLGDYRYEIGEHLGDVALAATADYGRGHVMVFGDTSTFQVLGLPFATEFIERVARWLAQGPGGPAWPRWLGLAVGLCGLAALASANPGAVVVPAAGAVVTAWLGCALWPSPAPAPLDPSGKLAVVDLAAAPRYPAAFFDAGSYAGVYTAIFRSGHLPVSSRRGEDALVPRAGLLAFVTPTVPLDEARLRALEVAVRTGATLLVADGRQGAEAANRLLSLCGLAIHGPPLGPVRAPWRDKSVEFVDAWPVEALPGRDARVDLESNHLPLVSETRVGAGRCIAVGDGRFLSDDKFEGEYQFNATNVEFVDALLADRLER